MTLTAPAPRKRLMPSSTGAKARSVQVVAVGLRRLYVCAGCARPTDVPNGRFATPGGRACARCGADVAEGLVVMERV